MSNDEMNKLAAHATAQIDDLNEEMADNPDKDFGKSHEELTNDIILTALQQVAKQVRVEALNEVEKAVVDKLDSWGRPVCEVRGLTAAIRSLTEKGD